MDIHDYFAATWTARGRLLDACAGLTPDEWTREFPFSWKSLRNLFAHIIEVEDSWMVEDIERRPWKALSDEERERRYATPASTRERGEEVAARTRATLASHVPRGLSEIRKGKDFAGDPADFTVEQILTHVFTHELRHQGQLQVLLRLLGKPAPNADWI